MAIAYFHPQASRAGRGRGVGRAERGRSLTSPFYHLLQNLSPEELAGLGRRLWPSTHGGAGQGRGDSASTSVGGGAEGLVVGGWEVGVCMRAVTERLSRPDRKTPARRACLLEHAVGPVHP